MTTKKKWIQGAIKHPGALKAKAKKADGISKEGKIKSSFIEKAEHSKNPTTRKQASLAKTLKGLGKK